MPAADSPAFRRRRASKGGRTRAQLYSRLWQQLLMRFCQERRLGQTSERRFRTWLKARGLDGTNGRG